MVMNATSQALDLRAANGASDGLAERIAVLGRRARPALIAFGVVLGSTLLLALLWPPKYRSTGTVLIEQQEIPNEFVRAAITSFADQRVRSISQRVMTASNLLEIIRTHDLYPERQRREPREKLLERMRGDIGLEMISADVVDPRQGTPTKATIAFNVSFDSRSPLLASKVANELTTLFLNENLEIRRRQAESTTAFLGEEVRRVGAEVADLERRIADFKSVNSQSLPELGQVNLQLLTRAEEELRAVQMRITALDQQIVYLDAQLAQIDPVSATYLDGGQRILTSTQRLKALRTQLASAKAIYGEDHPDVRRLQREVAGLDREVGAVDTANDLARRLADADGQLAQLRERYSANHPDVLRLERIVMAIKDQMRIAGGVALAPDVTERPDNPAFIQVKAQREAALNERSALQAQVAMLRARTADYERRMTLAPGVERDYSALVRELEGARAKYQEVRQKHLEARVSSKLEVEQKGERFTLIDPPMVPERRHSPNLPLILSMGLLLALGTAVGVAALLDQLDPSVRHRRDLENLVTVPPLAAIPWIHTDEEAALKQRRVRWSPLVAVACVLAMLLAVHLFVKPLDVLWHVVLRRIGI
jgi:uncharacterized protein involved in exopolysaccharide biosynthesis